MLCQCHIRRRIYVGNKHDSQGVSRRGQSESPNKTPFDSSRRLLTGGCLVESSPTFDLPSLHLAGLCLCGVFLLERLNTIRTPSRRHESSSLSCYQQPAVSTLLRVFPRNTETGLTSSESRVAKSLGEMHWCRMHYYDTSHERRSAEHDLIVLAQRIARRGGVMLVVLGGLVIACECL